VLSRLRQRSSSIFAGKPHRNRRRDVRGEKRSEVEYYVIIFRIIDSRPLFPLSHTTAGSHAFGVNVNPPQRVFSATYET
jgi:hypothetical protein